MIKEVGFDEFNNWFVKHRPENFSYDGRVELFDYLELMDNIKFDPIVFCVTYTEYKNIEEFWNDYNKEDYPSFSYIADQTTLIRICGGKGFIIEQF